MLVNYEFVRELSMFLPVIAENGDMVVIGSGSTVFIHEDGGGLGLWVDGVALTNEVEVNEENRSRLYRIRDKIAEYLCHLEKRPLYVEKIK